MNKIIGGLIVFALLAAALLGALLAGRDLMQSPEVQAAIAKQEQAKASELEARADAARALAAQEWTQTRAKEAAAGELAAAQRWYALGGGIGFFVLVVGGALAAVTWANTRARVIYPNENGLSPILIERRLDGQIIIADTARQLSGVLVIDKGGGVNQIMPPSEEAQLRLATQAQAAGVMVGIAKQSDGEAIAERVKSAAASLPVPQFAHALAAPGEVMEQDGPNFVYVKSAGNTKAQRELSDIGEFIRAGWGLGGLSRSRWLGKRLSVTGNKVTRGYYDTLTKRLEKAGVIRNDGEGWEPAVELDEALDAFGLAHEDSDPIGAE